MRHVNLGTRPGERVKFKRVRPESSPSESHGAVTIPGNLPRTIPVGPFRNRDFDAVPRDHLAWLLENRLLADEHLTAIAVYLDRWEAITFPIQPEDEE